MQATPIKLSGSRAHKDMRVGGGRRVWGRDKKRVRGGNVMGKVKITDIFVYMYETVKNILNVYLR